MTKLATIKLIAIATFATTSSFLACGDGGNSSLDGTGNGAGSWGNGGGGPSYSGGDAAATPSQAEPCLLVHRVFSLWLAAKI